MPLNISASDIMLCKDRSPILMIGDCVILELHSCHFKQLTWPFTYSGKELNAYKGSLPSACAVNMLTMDITAYTPRQL